MQDLVRTPVRFVFVSQSWRIVSRMKRTRRGVISVWWRICWEHCSWVITYRLQRFDAHYRHNLPAVKISGCMTFAEFCCCMTHSDTEHFTITRQATLHFGQVPGKAFKAKAGYWMKAQSTNQDTYQRLSVSQFWSHWRAPKVKRQHT